MKEFWIDFSGYVKVKANNIDEAERKLWSAKSPFRGVEGFSDDVWDIDGIEEVGNTSIDNPNKPNLQDIEDFWNDR